MKRVVVDTNLLFSALRSRNRSFRETLFSEEYIFYSSKYKHKERIIKGIETASKSEIYEYLNEVLQRIKFINEDFISLANYSKAYKLCKDVDEFDVPFVALALELNAQLWTNDKKLKKGIMSKGFDNFFEITQ